MSDFKIAVYDLKQAERFNGKFSKKISNVMDVRKVGTEYAEKYNENFEASGSFYELNKSENDKFIALAIKKNPKLKVGGDKPISKMNVEELKGFLTENEVGFESDAKKDDLIELAKGVEIPETK